MMRCRRVPGRFLRSRGGLADLQEDDLVTDRLDAAVDRLIEYAQALGAPELTIPRRIVRAPEIPVLGTGKTDYVAVQRIVETEAGTT